MPIAITPVKGHMYPKLVFQFYSYYSAAWMTGFGKKGKVGVTKARYPKQTFQCIRNPVPIASTLCAIT